MLAATGASARRRLVQYAGIVTPTGGLVRDQVDRVAQDRRYSGG
jgi:hypothetical protein